MKPIPFLYAFLFFYSATYSQQIKQLKTILFNKNSIYLVCRGTEQKKGFIAEKFNISDKNITHIGIGVYENGSLNIYNVSNVSEENSDLIQEKPEDFMNVSDIFYLSLWEYKSTREELFKLKKILQSYTSKKISFDTDFEENNAKLYCSEFCAVVLRELNPKAFSFSLSQIPLDHFYETILHRRILNYYPVDFFQVNPKFCKIYETRF